MSTYGIIRAKVADATGSLAMAMTLPALCYAVILAYGLYARRPATPDETAALRATELTEGTASPAARSA
jgi:hypothetical protein